MRITWPPLQWISGQLLWWFIQWVIHSNWFIRVVDSWVTSHWLCSDWSFIRRHHNRNHVFCLLSLCYFTAVSSHFLNWFWRNISLSWWSVHPPPQQIKFSWLWSVWEDLFTQMFLIRRDSVVNSVFLWGSQLLLQTFILRLKTKHTLWVSLADLWPFLTFTCCLTLQEHDCDIKHTLRSHRLKSSFFNKWKTSYWSSSSSSSFIPADTRHVKLFFTLFNMFLSHYSVENFTVTFRLADLSAGKYSLCIQQINLVLGVGSCWESKYHIADLESSAFMSPIRVCTSSRVRKRWLVRFGEAFSKLAKYKQDSDK